MVDLLQRLALAESPSDNPAAVAPVLAMLASELEQGGLSVRLFPGRVSAGTLFARPRERNEPSPLQLLVGHCDTVWPVGTVRQMPVRVEGETLRGPGVFDMKGGLVQMLYALRAVKDLSLRPPADMRGRDQLRRGDRQPRLHPAHSSAGSPRGSGLHPGTGLRPGGKAEDRPESLRQLHDHHQRPSRPRWRQPRRRGQCDPGDVLSDPEALRAQRRSPRHHRERGDDRRRAAVERRRRRGAGHRGRAGPDAAGRGRGRGRHPRPPAGQPRDHDPG